MQRALTAVARRVKDTYERYPWDGIRIQIRRQVRGPRQPHHRRIVAPERTLQRATVIVKRPLVHGATLPMIRKEPESDFELRRRQGGYLDVDRVVVDHLVPRLDLV